MTFKHGQAVQLKENPKLKGKVCGFAHMTVDHQVREAILLGLDTGFFDTTHCLYLHTLVCDPGNLEPSE